MCGAPNVAAGQKVIVATVGASLYPINSTEALVMKKAKIRGVESFGMICAEDELGLGESHDGILVLPADTLVGLSAAEYFQVEKDIVFEIGLTPNRSDAFSHIGTARDLAAALNVGYRQNVALVKPDLSAYDRIIRPDQVSETFAPLDIAVEVQDTEGCPRYAGVTISNITVKESPKWLQNILKAIGVRSINNVVDATNYVLHEYGQPLHPFDAAKIEGDKVVVRKATEGEKFVTLDGVERKLAANDLVICDAKKPMCIAGVFGGAESGVSDSTTSIFLESAYFSPTYIRKTSTHHGLRTDAATHFEKGCDPNITIEALKRAALLITELTGGMVSSGITDIYHTPIQDYKVDISFAYIKKLCGFEIPLETIKKILSNLEIKIESESETGLILNVPPFKTDVRRPADVVEEIIRIYGYNSFPLPKRLNSSIAFSPAINVAACENIVAALLTGGGFSEISTNSVSQSKFESNDALKAEQIMLLNSQTSELDCLRTSILYTGLEVIAYNQNRRFADLHLYEIGKTYHKTEAGYKEKKHLALFLTGNTTAANWLDKGRKSDFYHLKANVDNIFSRFGLGSFKQAVTETAPFSFALQYSIDDTVVATLGQVSSAIAKQFDVKQEVWFADLNWDYLLERSQFNKIEYKEMPKFPAVRRDLALVVNRDLRFETIEQLSHTEAKKLLKEISLFDVYTGDKIEAGKKSYAISLVFQHADKTLTDTEIEKVMNKLMQRFESELGAVIRK